MRRTHPAAPFLALCLALLPAAALADPPGGAKWEKLDDENGVAVYSKEVPGSDLVAFKGEAVIDAPLPRVLGVLMDDAHRPEWVDRLEESRVLERVSDHEFVLYQHYGLPVILSDRDYVYRGVGYTRPDGAVVLELSSCSHGDAPETVGVRANLERSAYVLTPEAGGRKTRVVVEIHTDPRGAIPSWLVNLIQRSWPEKTLNGIRAAVGASWVKDYPLPPVRRRVQATSVEAGARR